MTELLHSKFVGMHELRTGLPKLLDGLPDDGPEIVITRQGKPVAVLVEVQHYLEMREAIREFSDPSSLKSLRTAREEIDAGNGITAEEVFRQKGL